MPIAALAAPLIATELGLDAATLGGVLGTAAIGAGLGAGTGAAFGEITGQGAGPGALSGAIGGAAPALGGAAGEAIGIGSAAGSIAGGAAGGALGGAVTGGNPLIGAVEGAAAPAIGAVTGISGTSATPSAPTSSITPTAPATGAGSAAGSAGSAGAGSAAAGSSIPLDPTSGGGPGISGGGANVAGPSDFLLPTGTTPTGGDTFSATGFTPISGAGVTSGGTIDAGSGGFQGLLDKLTSNPAMLLQAAPLALSLFGGQGPYPSEKSLSQLATNLGTQGQSLAGYVQSGTLPAGAQANVDAARKGAEAGIRSADARLGLSGSTMEAQQLGEAKQQAAGQQFLLADRLLGQGIDAQGAAANVYSATLRAEMARDQQFQTALTSFASGLARGGTPYPTGYGVSGYGG